MDNHCNCSPAKRKADERRSARTMMELRAMMDAERTQPITLEARAKPTTAARRIATWIRERVTR